MNSAPLILGIESTCDETGIALVRGTELLTDVTATSMDQHVRFGGIIPEIASRAHLESFMPALDTALDQAGVTLNQVDAIACAAGPGLVGSLTVGITSAKGLATSLGVPLYGVNHVIGHLAIDMFEHGRLPDRFIGLVASGGHSNLLLIENIARSVTELGGTLDDAAGEAFDKVGRLLGLPYPAGPHMDRLAASAENPAALRFPRGLGAGKDKDRYRYDFSFSGLKTAVSRHLTQNPDADHAEVAAAFSESINDSLSAKAVRAAVEQGCNTIVVGGGFAANSRLRQLLAERAAKKGVEVRIPPMRYCTDNGAQIAAIGALLVEAGASPSPANFGPDSSMDLSEIYVS
ncbi:tRNA (adenosine(37)-N6)-threonylcarbamoyltransferase complex transferase subunit TsaD [Actinomyces minihominis]|uniref:tRNA (adenosine(37)-N6)-threonylcarbamoyltransferase complex transferase subunit TsaD n=1 Tax=Actinomyces minihominis TaxID=2002838 RepID=UPI000C089A90|nr:tRNA (adenosine(37)-N6)-threonylcarbamoyltransferase complex transferase subunit TsaD [Actinomyces minihominis]